MFCEKHFIPHRRRSPEAVGQEVSRKRPGLIRHYTLFALKRGIRLMDGMFVTLLANGLLFPLSPPLFHIKIRLLPSVDEPTGARTAAILSSRHFCAISGTRAATMERNVISQTHKSDITLVLHTVINLRAANTIVGAFQGTKGIF